MNPHFHAEVTSLVSPSVMSCRKGRTTPAARDRPKLMQHEDLMESLYSGIAPLLALRLTERERQEQKSTVGASVYRAVLSIVLRAPDVKTVKTFESALRVWIEQASSREGRSVGPKGLGLTDDVEIALELVKDVAETLIEGGTLKSESKALQFYATAGFGAHEEDEEIVPPSVEFLKHEVASSRDVIVAARRMGSAVFLEHVVKVMGRRGQGWKEVVEALEKKGSEEKKPSLSGREMLNDFLKPYLKNFPIRAVGKLGRRYVIAVHGLYQSFWAYIVSHTGDRRKAWREAATVLMETILQDGRVTVLEAFIDTMTDHELRLEFCYLFLTKRLWRGCRTFNLPNRVFPHPPPSGEPQHSWTTSKLDLSMFSKLATLRGCTEYEWTALPMLLQGVAISWLHVNSGSVAVSHTKALSRVRRDRELEKLKASIEKGIQMIEIKSGKDGKRALRRLKLLLKVIYMNANEENGEYIAIEKLAV